MSSELFSIISLVLQILSLLVIGRAVCSWFDPGMRSPIGRFLFTVTEPIIGPIRQIVPAVGAFDFSPIIALLLLQVIQQILRSAAS